MNRINQTFETNDKKVFIAYIVCGDPDLNSTLNIMNSLVDSGVDLIELGIPFTDPIADGPVIQKSIERSLKKKTSIKDALKVTKKFREKNKHTPVVLMGYLNPIENLGYKKFASLSSNSGVDGVLVVDSPPEESSMLASTLKDKGICNIFLASPTTDKDRLKNIVKESSGYLYYVSLKGITGSQLKNFDSIKKSIKHINKIDKKRLPVAVGFGIKDPKTARKISEFADGIIIGSSIVELIQENSHNRVKMIQTISKYAKAIKKSLVCK